MSDLADAAGRGAGGKVPAKFLVNRNARVVEVPEERQPLRRGFFSFGASCRPVVSWLVPTMGLSQVLKRLSNLSYTLLPEYSRVRPFMASTFCGKFGTGMFCLVNRGWSGDCSWCMPELIFLAVWFHPLTRMRF